MKKNNIMKELEGKIEKTCKNCEDLIVCVSKDGKTPEKICDHWQPRFNIIQDMLEQLQKEKEITMTDILNSL